MADFLQQSIDDESLVLWHDYRRREGTFDDLSGNGNDGVGSNVELRGGGVYFRDPDGYIMVADAPELQLTEGTIDVLGYFSTPDRPVGATGARLVSKRDVGGNNYEFIITEDVGPIQRWYTYDNIASRSLTVDYVGARCLGVTFENGQVPEGWMNGLDAGAFSGAMTAIADDADLYIGNWYSATRSTYNIIQAVLIFNRVLTETEHSKLYGELLKIQRW